MSRKISLVIIGGWMVFILIVGAAPEFWPEYVKQINFGCAVLGSVLTFLLIIKAIVEHREIKDAN